MAQGQSELVSTCDSCSITLGALPMIPAAAPLRPAKTHTRAGAKGGGAGGSGAEDQPGKGPAGSGSPFDRPSQPMACHAPKVRACGVRLSVLCDGWPALAYKESYNLSSHPTCMLMRKTLCSDPIPVRHCMPSVDATTPACPRLALQPPVPPKRPYPLCRAG